MIGGSPRFPAQGGKDDRWISDVVVVGSGGGGLSAAIVSATEGLEVVVVEKSRFLGGTTAMSGGGVWIPGNALMHAAGDEDSAGNALSYLLPIIGPDRDTTSLQAFLQNAPKAIEYLGRYPELQFTTRKSSPDYYSDHPSATKTSRAVDLQAFDGRQLGADLDMLRPPRPESLLFGGMPVNGVDIHHLSNALRSFASFSYSVRLLASYIKQRILHGQSTRLVLGRAMVARMLTILRRLPVTLHRSTVVRELIIADGKVSGVVVEVQGTLKRLYARKGVVLATGGFGHGEVMRAKWIPSPQSHFSVGAADNQGDGIRLGLSVGAVVPEDARDSAYWVPVSNWRRRDGATAVFPHLVTDRAKPGVIAVDETGRRFVNEAASYHDFVRAMHAGREGRPAIPAYLICDHRALKRYGLGLVRPWPFPRRRFIGDGYLTVGSTIAELAGRLGLDPETLTATVSRYNADARDGLDPEFGKGSTAYNRHMGDAGHRPNPCLAPLETGPFYGVRIFPGNVGTSRGLRTDVFARVVGADGRPIGGLYAVGNDADSVLAGSYPGPGASLGPALTAGYVAGLHMAGSANGEPADNP